MKLETFFEKLTRWATAETDVLAVALVGSPARAAARDTSDIDLILIVDDPQRYLARQAWIEAFGKSRAKTNRILWSGHITSSLVHRWSRSRVPNHNQGLSRLASRP